MKCFEINIENDKIKIEYELTVNMKCFEIRTSWCCKLSVKKLTVNMKCFEMLREDKQ